MAENDGLTEQQQRKRAEQARVASLDREGTRLEKRSRIQQTLERLQGKLEAGAPQAELLRARIERLREDYQLLGHEAEIEAIKGRRRPLGGDGNVVVAPPTGAALVRGQQ